MQWLHYGRVLWSYKERLQWLGPCRHADIGQVCIHFGAEECSTGNGQSLVIAEKEDSRGICSALSLQPTSAIWKYPVLDRRVCWPSGARLDPRQRAPSRFSSHPFKQPSLVGPYWRSPRSQHPAHRQVTRLESRPILCMYTNVTASQRLAWGAPLSGHDRPSMVPVIGSVCILSLLFRLIHG